MRTVMRIGENSSVGVDMIAGFDVVFLNSVRNQTHSHSHSHSLQFNLMSSFFLSFFLSASLLLPFVHPTVCLCYCHCHFSFHFNIIGFHFNWSHPRHYSFYYIVINNDNNEM